MVENKFPLIKFLQIWAHFEPEYGLSSLSQLRATSEVSRSPQLSQRVHVRVAVVLNDDGEEGGGGGGGMIGRRSPAPLSLSLSLCLLARSSQIRIYNESWETEEDFSSDR